eukprot:1157781-Pelagomonas_calceolata.AAC.2
MMRPWVTVASTASHISNERSRPTPKPRTAWGPGGSTRPAPHHIAVFQGNWPRSRQRKSTQSRDSAPCTKRISFANSACLPAAWGPGGSAWPAPHRTAVPEGTSQPQTPVTVLAVPEADARGRQ